MKLILVAYNEALDDQVLALLREHNVQGYTKWVKTYGKGVASEPHLGSAVWPKANNVMAVVTDDETSRAILEGIRELRRHLSREGIKAFVLPCEEVT